MLNYFSGNNTSDAGRLSNPGQLPQTGSAASSEAHSHWVLPPGPYNSDLERVIAGASTQTSGKLLSDYESHARGRNPSRELWASNMCAPLEAQLNSTLGEQVRNSVDSMPPGTTYAIAPELHSVVDANAGLASICVQWRVAVNTPMYDGETGNDQQDSEPGISNMSTDAVTFILKPQVDVRQDWECTHVQTLPMTGLVQ